MRYGLRGTYEMSMDLENGNHVPLDVDIHEIKKKMIDIDRLVNLVREQELELIELKKEGSAVTNLNEMRE